MLCNWYTNDFDTTLSCEIVMKLYLTIPKQEYIYIYIGFSCGKIHWYIFPRAVKFLDTLQPDIKFVNDHLTFIFVLLINTSMKFGSPLH